MPDSVMAVTIDPHPGTRESNLPVTATVRTAGRRLVDVDESTVEVHLFAAARAAVGSSEMSVPPARLSAILDRIQAEHPAFADVRPRCSFLVDGTSVHDDVSVPGGSRIDVLPPFAGG
jgi:molybdopterin converting factor small subunit